MPRRLALQTPLHRRDRLRAVGDGDVVAAALLQDALGEQRVDLVVLGEQHAARARSAADGEGRLQGAAGWASCGVAAVDAAQMHHHRGRTHGADEIGIKAGGPKLRQAGARQNVDEDDAAHVRLTIELSRLGQQAPAAVGALGAVDDDAVERTSARCRPLQACSAAAKSTSSTDTPTEASASLSARRSSGRSKASSTRPVSETGAASAVSARQASRAAGRGWP